MLFSGADMEPLAGPDPRIRRWTRLWAGLLVPIWLGMAVFPLAVVVQPEGGWLNATLWCVGCVPCFAVGHLVVTAAIAHVIARQPGDHLDRPTLGWQWACVALELLLSLPFLVVLLLLLFPRSFPVG
jgi:hypothetical protein